MSDETPTSETGWMEDDSQHFIAYGDYYVPQREQQMEIICELVPQASGEFKILDLGCGQGLLGEALLQRHARCMVRGLDRSKTMRKHAASRLVPFGARFETGAFDLAASDWRDGNESYTAIVSSLCVHHLRGPQKEQLYADLFSMLAPGGALIIADVIEPASAEGARLAARQWNDAVRERALALDGHLGAWHRFREDRWNTFLFPDPVDHPSPIAAHLKWLQAAGFERADVFWVFAGHAIYGGYKGT